MAIKGFYLVVAFLLFQILSFSCEMESRAPHGITFSSPLLYNQYIVDRHKTLVEDIDIYNLAMEHDYAFATKTLDSIFIHSTQSLQDIQQMAPFKGDSSFREVSADFFKYYSGNFIDMSKKLIHLKGKMDSGLASHDEIRTLNEMAKKIDEHSESLQMRAEEIQRRFARKNNFTLSVTETNKTIK